MIGLMTNLKNGATTQLRGLPYTSLVEFQGRLLATTAAGIVEAFSGDDNVPEAWFKTVLTDFGDAAQKRIRALFVGLESTGPLEVTVEDAAGNTRAYEVRGGDEDDFQRSVKVPVGRDGKHRYWSLKIANVDGEDFAVDAVDVDVIVLSRRP